MANMVIAAATHANTVTCTCSCGHMANMHCICMLKHELCVCLFCAATQNDSIHVCNRRQQGLLVAGERRAS